MARGGAARGRVGRGGGQVEGCEAGTRTDRVGAGTSRPRSPRKPEWPCTRTRAHAHTNNHMHVGAHTQSGNAGSSNSAKCRATPFSHLLRQPRVGALGQLLHQQGEQRVLRLRARDRVEGHRRAGRGERGGGVRVCVGGGVQQVEGSGALDYGAAKGPMMGAADDGSRAGPGRPPASRQGMREQTATQLALWHEPLAAGA